MPDRKEYYAVEKGRELDKPTIYSSWAKTHVRTSGHPSNEYRGFATLSEAQNHLDSKHGSGSYDTDIASKHESTKPSGNEIYYGVANGRGSGVTDTYSGKGGAENAVNGYSHACHKSFRTEAQAEQFAQDWRSESMKVMTGKNGN